MNDFIRVFGDITIAETIVYLTAVFFLIKAAKDLYAMATTYHDKKQDIDVFIEMSKQNAMEIEQLTKDIDGFIELSKQNAMEIEQLTRNLKIFADKSASYQVTSLKTKIYGYHDKFTAKNYVTHDDLDMFMQCVNRYSELGGNGIVQNKYMPEVLALEVRE